MKIAIVFLLLLTTLVSTRTVVCGFVVTSSSTTTTTTRTASYQSIQTIISKRRQQQQHNHDGAATRNKCRQKSCGIIIKASEKEEFLPETSFGAEVVPEGQRPVNEYLDMKRAPLFGWASNEVGTDGLLLRLAIIYVVVFATVGYPIAGATFTQDGFLLQKIAAANVGTLGLVLAVLVRLYSGWGYVAARLQSKVIEYEETGWYDGNFEPKTEAELKRDRFLYQSDVRPAVDRLKVLTLSAATLWVASCVGLNVATSMKPVFNEYDPTVLERVRYDEDFANKAAQQSGGRPTYCDNRYYRAVANGGQGCN